MPASLSQRQPFPGMRSFEVADAELFFGQETQINALLKRLGDSRLVAVLGESGCGKSSLVKAGLVARLVGRRGAGASAWHVAVTRPGSSPLRNLADAVAAIVDRPSETIAKTIASSSLGLRRVFRDASLPNGHRALLIVDQFEELFRYYKQAGHAAGARQNEAAFFVKSLLGLSEDVASEAPAAPVYVVLTMRSEYLGDCALFYGLAETVNDGAYLLPKMTRSQIESGIIRPLNLLGATMANDLLQRLLNETELAQQDGLPLLQHALRRVWDRASRRAPLVELTLADFLPDPHKQPFQVDGKGAALSPLEWHLNDALDEIVSDLGPRAALAERLFKLLGEYDHKNIPVRRSCSLATAIEVTGASEGQVLDCLNAFRDEEQGRTFVMPPAKRDEDLRKGKEDIDISHEALLRRWRRLQRWIAQEQRDADEFRSLAGDAQAGRPLYRGEVRHFLRWRRQFKPTVAWARRYAEALPSHQERVITWAEADDHLTRSRRRGWLRAGAIAAVFALIVGVSAVLAYTESQILMEAADPIEGIDRVTEGTAWLPSSMLDLNHVEHAIWKAYARPRPTYWLDFSETHDSALGTPLVAVSEYWEKEFIVAWGSRVAIWDPERETDVAGKCSPPSCRTLTAANEAAISSISAGEINSERVIVLGTRDGRVTITYPDRTGASTEAVPALEFSGAVSSVAISVDGESIVATGRLSGTADGPAVAVLVSVNDDKHDRRVFGAPAHRSDVIACAFDGANSLLTAGRDGVVARWNVNERRLTAGPTPVLPIGPLTDLAFAPGVIGRVAVAGSGRDVLVLDGRTLDRIQRFSSGDEPSGPSQQVAMNRTGNLLAFAAGDSVTIVDVGVQSAVMTLPKQHGTVTSLAFDPRKDRLITATNRGAIEVFQPAVGQPERAITTTITAAEDINAVGFSADADGEYVAAAVDRAVRVWTARVESTTGKAGRQLVDAPAAEASLDLRSDDPIFPRGIYRVAFLGNDVLTADSDGQIHRWGRDAAQLVDGGTFKGSGEKLVLGLAVSPDGHWVAAGDRDGELRFWRSETAYQTEPVRWAHDQKGILKPTRDNHIIRDVQFSSDARYLASAGADLRIRVWDLSEAGRDPRGTPPLLACELVGHLSSVRSIAFHASGQWLASGSDDGTVRLWSLKECQSGREIANANPLRRYPQNVQGVGFAGRMLWAVAKNGQVTVFTMRENEDPARESYELIVPGAFKLATHQSRVAISTSGSLIFTFPTGAQSIISLLREAGGDSVRNHQRLPGAQGAPTAVKASDSLSDPAFQGLIRDAWEREEGKRFKARIVLERLTMSFLANPTRDVPGSLWNDVCWRGSLGDEVPAAEEVDVISACYAAVNWNPSDWNSRATLAFALARRANGDQARKAEALREFDAAVLFSGFRASQQIRDEFKKLREEVSESSSLTKEQRAFENQKFRDYLKKLRSGQ